MSPRKLTDSDKKEILKLYRQPEETTSTLARRYEVSSSTISRFLKSNLLESEYEALIQQKRLSRTPQRSQEPEAKTVEKPKKVITTRSTPASQPEATDSSTAVSYRQRRPSVEMPQPITTSSAIKAQRLQPEPFPDALEEGEVELFDEEDGPDEAEVSALKEMFGEELADLEDEEDLEEEDWEDDVEPEVYSIPSHRESIQVLPLSEASFPRTCYLVIDRAAELITRPLKDFSDLGKIPVEEVQQKTLPIFDNHRVARRFSNRSQRVIKVPDGRMLYKTCEYLLDKGITRLLIDGQVYSLSSY